MGAERARSDQRASVIAAGQHGVITRGQLLRVGITKQGIYRRVQRGSLHPVHRGVFSVGHPRLTFEGRCMAAFLACCADVGGGATAAVSHLSAASLWGLLRLEGGPIHVSLLTAGGRRKREGVTVHRPPSLSPADLTRRTGIWVTRPARTLRDLRRTVPSAFHQRALRKAIDLRLVSEREVHDRWDLTRSELERMFLRLCRRHHLPLPEVNARIGGFEVDFLWRTPRVIAETDGFRHHGNRAAFERDRARDAALQRRGFHVLRFTHRQVSEASQRVASTLRSLICRDR